MNSVLAAFETDEDFKARLARVRDVCSEATARGEVQMREAALWERRTREEMIAAINRLAAAIEGSEPSAFGGNT